MLSQDKLLENAMKVVKPYLYHQNTIPTDTLSVIGTITQEFYAFTNSLSSYAFNVVEPPSGSISFNFSSGTISVKSTFIPNVGWNTVNINERIVSRDKCTIQIISNDSITYGATTIPYNIETSVNDVVSNVVMSQNPIFKEWLRFAYPYEVVSRDYLPRCVIDVTERAVINYPYINYDVWREEQSIQFQVYSLYPKELFEITKAIEKAIISNRENIANEICLIVPSGTSGIGKNIDDILFKTITFNIKILNRNITG